MLQPIELAPPAPRAFTEPQAMDHQAPAYIELERARLQRRRELLGGGPASADDAGFVAPIVTGLALSGGGIRSATLSLGMLQALADKDALKDIDYLSTVSGGGYAGSFLCSLYTPRSVRERKAAARPGADSTTTEGPTTGELEAAAARATEQLAALEQRSGRPPQGYAANALDWLRNSSRYLAPRGSSDYFYAAAMWLRNLAAVHYVIGVSLVGVLMCLILLNDGAVAWRLGWCIEPAHWCPLLPARWQQWPLQKGLLYLVIASGIAFVFVLPLGIGYWLTEASRQTGPGWLAGLVTWPSLFGLVTPIVLMIAGVAMPDPLADTRASHFAWSVAIVLLLSWLAYALCWSRAWLQARETGGATMNVTRTKFTQSLANAMRACLAALLLAAVLIACAAVDRLLGADWWKGMSGIGAFALAASAFRPMLARLLKLDKEREPRSVRLMPLAAALLGLALVVLLWGVVALRLAAQEGLVPYALVAILALSIATGRSFQFLNLSTIQNFYSARIVRAYLGATNAARFAGSDENRWASITEPHPLDDMTLEQYYGPVGSEAMQRLNSLAPQHIVNVTLNKTVGKYDPLVEQDRKGLPLAVTPHGLLVDGEFWLREPPPPKAKGVLHLAHRRIFEPLMLGRWIGISGAAFAPGLGRASRPELSLLSVLVNVRLGYWWRVTLPPPRTAPTRWWWPVSTQVHLLREARGRFLGEGDSHWYLTDGGHFENTGVYELLRRRVDVILALDNGADAHYHWDDVANLIRIASLDFGAQFHALTQLEIASAFAGTPHEGLTRLFGNPNGFDCKCREGQHFLIAYRVRLPSGPGFAAPKSVTVVFVKPRLTEDASLDLVQYQALHQAFPQEPTSDQFFDDEQWESYRKLGRCEGRKMLDDGYWGERPPFRALVEALYQLNSPSDIAKPEILQDKSP